MWQLFANLKLSAYKGAYDGCPANCVDAAKLSLDPITVKSCQWKRLLESTDTMRASCDMALKILDGDNDVIGFSGKKQSKIPVVAEKYRPHIMSLVEWDILNPLGPYRSSWVSGYFAVAKNEQIARTIMSGGLLSRECKKPPGVNILDIRDLLLMISKLNPRKICCSQMDLRHWFHQIGLEKTKLRHLFHIVLGKETFEFLRLPMGWSFSPFLCQVISWALYTYRLPGDKQLFKQVSQEGLPSHLSLLEDPGFATVLYDNFFMICEDQSVLDEIRSRLVRNMKIFEAIIKEGTLKSFPNKIMRMDLEREPCVDDEKSHLPIHLGLQMGITHRGWLKFTWRVDPHKIEQWKMLRIESLKSARQISQVVGRIIWANSLSLSPLYTIGGVLKIAASLGRHVGTTYSRWDTEYVRTEAESLVLHAAWEKTLRNEWRCDEHRPCREHLYLFTDASSTGWGFVLTDICGLIIQQEKFEWKEASCHWHIFIQEVAACVWSMKLVKMRGRALTVFCDNTAAEHAVRRGYSSNAIALTLIENAKLEEESFIMRRIHTSINPSDPNSRGIYCTAEKAAYAVAHLDDVINNGKTPPDKNSIGLRHCDPDDFEEVEEYLMSHLEDLNFDPASLPPSTYRPVHVKA